MLNISQTTKLLIAAAVCSAAPSLLIKNATAHESRPRVFGAVSDPAREPQAPARTQFRACGFGVKISYVGAVSAPPHVTRTREEARALAGAISILARSQGSNISEIARAHSDDAASREQDGFLGTFRVAKDTDAVGRALLGMKIGCVAGPIDAREGFYIVERVAMQEFAFQGLLVVWGGIDPMGRVLRTKEEAKIRAEELWSRIERDPQAFDALIKTESDDPLAAEKNGYTNPAARGEIHPDTDKVLLNTTIGALAPPFETPKGYLIIKRIPVEVVTFDSLLVQHRDVSGTALGITRSRDEAKERADAILKEVESPNADFASLAKQYSDDPADALRAGRRTLGVSLGSPVYVRAVETLKIGEATIVESKVGFHVIRRVELELE
ncbi:MAG: peptidylprolyl isomerase [Planctomycetota bacterium]